MFVHRVKERGAGGREGGAGGGGVEGSGETSGKEGREGLTLRVAASPNRWRVLHSRNDAGVGQRTCELFEREREKMCQLQGRSSKDALVMFAPEEARGEARGISV